VLLVNVSGRGDKDMAQAQGLLLGPPHEPLRRDVRAQSGAFGAFVMLGDPDLETSAAILDELVEGGADMIEVGIPFSDPVADGPVIQAAAVRALAAGVRTADCFALIRGFRGRHPDVPVGILTYANLVLARGRDAFYRAAADRARTACSSPTCR
jgi:tryptophan synthase alpha chain